MDVLTGWGTFTSNTTRPLWSVYLSSLVTGVTIGAVFAFGEEYGWRGYLLPKLLPLGEFKASLLVGVIWALWHTPPLLAGLNYAGAAPLAAIAVFVVVVTAMSVVFTRFFVASRGSVLVVAVLHGSFNSFSDRLIGPAYMHGNPLVVSMGLVAAIVLVLIVVVIHGRSGIVAERRDRRAWPSPSR